MLVSFFFFLSKISAVKVHVADTIIAWKTWPHHVDWLNILFIIETPLYGYTQAFWVPLQLKTAAWAVAYYCLFWD